jgi:hypothetical protein
MASVAEFISVLHQSHTQAKTWHNRTEILSEHLALGSYYNEILEPVDGLIESLQGIKGRVDGYTTKPLVDYKEGQSVSYFKGLYDYIQKEREGVGSESWIQNQVDTIAELVAETLYQLSLK